MIVLLALLALAAPASAGTIKPESDCSFRYYCSHKATYTAAAGERNDVTVSWPEPGRVVIHDAGAPVSGCLRVDEHTAMCGAPASESFQILINLGDGDDVAHTTSASVDGGTGDDALTGDQGELMGGPGSDVLTATGFGAWFVDGDGKHPAPDRYLGAPGKINSIDYTGRTEDLRIDLRSPFTTADGDYLENVSSAIGGLGDDVLIGNDGPNELYGGPGADRLLGLGGDDKLFTGIGSGAIVYSDPLGRDVVEGGAGNDHIHVGSRHSAGNLYRCGAGRDFIDQTQRRDFVGGDCEKLAVGPTIETEVRIHARSSAFLTDPDNGVYIVRADGQVVARGKHRLTLNALGRRLLRERGRLRVQVSLREGPDRGGFRMELRR